MVAAVTRATVRGMYVSKKTMAWVARSNDRRLRTTSRALLKTNSPKSLFEKYQAASRLSIKRVIATYTKVSLVVGNSS